MEFAEADFTLRFSIYAYADQYSSRRFSKVSTNAHKLRISCDVSSLYVLLFPPSHLSSSPFFFSLPASRNSDPGSHSRPFSPPPHYGSCLAFLSREHFSSFFPRRPASNCAYPRWALSAVDPFFYIYILQVNSKAHHGGIGTPGPTL